MKTYDFFSIGIYNLRRSLLRTVLTTLGVMIGIGMLSSMISFSSGMEKNVTDAVSAGDLFTSIMVTSLKIDVEDAMHGNIRATDTNAAPLNDSTLSLIKSIKGVKIAYPEVSVPARILFDSTGANLSLKAVPLEMKEFAPYNEIKYGKFFTNDSMPEIIMTVQDLRNLKIIVKTDGVQDLSESERKSGFQLLKPEAIIGREIDITTASVNIPKFGDKDSTKSPNLFSMMGAISELRQHPFTNVSNKFKVVGIIDKGKRFDMGVSSSITLYNAKKLPNTEFKSVWQVLNNSEKNKSKDTYNSIYVRAENAEMVDAVKKSLEKMNFGVLTITDQLVEIRKSFLIIGAILSAIGIVALIIAALGIINTMVMSILERKREIGIMKAIGGSEKDIRNIFFVEAAIIGLAGGISGLLLGKLFTSITNFIINAYIKPPEVPSFTLFTFPLWLILGSIGFSMLVSLAAGLYPAYRAARVDPVQALRHE